MQITCKTMSAYHVRHVVSYVIRRDRLAIKFDRTEIAFILALVHGLKRLADERGEETGMTKENP